MNGDFGYQYGMGGSAKVCLRIKAISKAVSARNKERPHVTYATLVFVQACWRLSKVKVGLIGDLIVGFKGKTAIRAKKRPVRGNLWCPGQEEGVWSSGPIGMIYAPLESTQKREPGGMLGVAVGQIAPPRWPDQI